MANVSEAFTHGNSKTLTDEQAQWLQAIIRAAAKDGVPSFERPGDAIKGVSALAAEIGASKLALMSAACGLSVSLSQHKLIGLYVAAYVKASQPSASA